MPINKCKVCGNKFFKEPLLRYKNMPKSAQFFPDKGRLRVDKGINLEVFQCSGCGLVQLDTEPVPYYRQVIRAAAFSEEMMDFRRKQFSDWVQKFSLKGKKVVEVGCGRGEYLFIMRQCQVKAYGLEYSKDSVNQCIKNGLNVSKGFIENANYRLNNAPFDAFYILSFLEHLPKPNLILRGIYNNLKENAVGLIEVPNFDMILKKNLFSEFINDHLFYFTRETLKFILGLNGFEIIDCKDVWHEYIISAVVKKRQKMDLSHFYKYQNKLKKEIGEYIQRFKDKGVAIWGAGHQALAIISLMNLSDKIKYVVDSASFKQNKFIPAAHIPIVSPDELNFNPVDAIIVMAASYSDEVVKTIRKRFNKKMDISILRNFGLETA